MHSVCFTGQWDLVRSLWLRYDNRILRLFAYRVYWPGMHPWLHYSTHFCTQIGSEILLDRVIGGFRRGDSRFLLCGELDAESDIFLCVRGSYIPWDLFSLLRDRRHVSDESQSNGGCFIANNGSARRFGWQLSVRLSDRFSLCDSYRAVRRVSVCLWYLVVPATKNWEGNSGIIEGESFELICAFCLDDSKNLWLGPLSLAFLYLLINLFVKRRNHIYFIFEDDERTKPKQA